MQYHFKISENKARTTINWLVYGCSSIEKLNTKNAVQLENVLNKMAGWNKWMDKTQVLENIQPLKSDSTNKKLLQKAFKTWKTFNL